MESPKESSRDEPLIGERFSYDGTEASEGHGVRLLKYYQPFNAWLDKRFAVKARGSSIASEIRGGIIMFVTSCYIILINPTILARGGLDPRQTTGATIITAAIGTFLTGWFSNLPLFVGPGMGLNTYFACELLKGATSWNDAYWALLIASSVFTALACSRALMPIVRIVPLSLKKGLIVGLGLFQCFVALDQLKLSIPGGMSSPRSSGDMFTAEALCAAVTVLVSALFIVFNVNGGLLYGVVFGTIVGHTLGLNSSHTSDNVAQVLQEAAGNALEGTAPSDLLVRAREHLNLPQGKGLDSFFASYVYPLGNGIDDLTLVLRSALVIMVVTLVDAGGVMVGIAGQSSVLEDNDSLLNAPRALACLGFAGIISTFAGSSPPIVFLESSAAVAGGARTGICAITCAALCLFSLFFTELLEFVPPEVGYGVLILVGSFMMAAVLGIDWDLANEGIPAFITIIFTVMCCSLERGVTLGLISYVVLNIPIWAAIYLPSEKLLKALKHLDLKFPSTFLQRTEYEIGAHAHQKFERFDLARETSSSRIRGESVGWI